VRAGRVAGAEATWRIGHSVEGKGLIVRRGGVLIYETAVVYFLFAPWNYLLLAVLLFRRRTDTGAKREFPSTWER
jgi:hypothetical protein